MAEQGDTPAAMPPTVIVLGDAGTDAFQRSRRGAEAYDLVCHAAAALPAEQPPGWLWLLAAGTWPTAVPFPCASATGRAGALLGLARPAEAGAQCDEALSAWDDWRRRSAGDGDRLAPPAGTPPAVLLDPGLSARWWAAVVAGGCPDAVLSALLADRTVRQVHWTGADVVQDRRLRVVQVITSLQRGGAERLALDLHGALPGERLAAHLVVAGDPVRAAHALPGDAVTCAGLGPRPERMAQAARMAAQLGADVVHAHLLTGEDLQLFSARGLPLLVTVHNAAPGWPAGLAGLSARCLLVACSRRVEADLAQAIPGPARRTVWNGIVGTALAPSPATRQRGQALRRRLGIASGAAVLVALANPRAQKRLEQLPSLVAPLQRALGRPVHVLVAGEAGSGPGAAEAEALFAQAVAAHGAEDRVHRLGMVEDVAGVLAAADVLVAPSAWEGLSLAHLEALAAGIPVVTSDVGGAAEVASFHPHVHLLPVAGGATAWVAMLARVLGSPPPRVAMLHAAFTTAAMARGYARLYPAAIALARPAPGVSGVSGASGLWLVINNLSTGGAQSSARRLLLHLHGTGVRVRVALLQEAEDLPSAGRAALLAAGIPVLVLPPPGRITAEESAARLAAAITGDPPAAVLLWNAMPAHKLLLAEQLLTVPLWDVSPGEMNFASLARVFTQLPRGLALRDARDYGARLAGAVVKFAGEAARAAATFGFPVAVIANGVELPAVPAPPLQRGRLVFGTAARLSPDKRLEDLFAALRLAAPALPAWELRVAGGVDGDEAYGVALRAGCADLPVVFMGGADDLGGFLAGLDAFVLIAEPAGCPNASLEAMASGLPVVATAVGGMDEQVVPEVSGLLVPPRDAAALAAALVRVAGDPGLRARWGAAGRQRIAERFTVARMADDYRRLCLGG